MVTGAEERVVSQSPILGDLRWKPKTENYDVFLRILSTLRDSCSMVKGF